ncbi:MAG: TonB-dependent receptor [Bacteroidetes bacterium]|nr:TonB-dependent receptor [Bacteroidota bacterium]
MKTVLCCWFVIWNISAQAQLTDSISLKVDSIHFDTFIQKIESQTNYHFYYRPEWVKTIIVRGDFNQVSLAKILDKIFENSTLRYFVVDRTIFITNNRTLTTKLPSNYFLNQQVSNDSVSSAYLEFLEPPAQSKADNQVPVIIGKTTGSVTGNATVAGVIRDKQNGEPVIGATLSVEKLRMGTATDAFGYYSLTLPRGQHQVVIRSIGMKTHAKQIILNADGKLNIDLEEEVTALKEVIVKSDKDIALTGTQMGVERLDVKAIKQIPLALGEADIMKVVLTLPGVQSVGEGTVGLNVRGGASNQNLILYNDATVYNPSHLFGFFSTFNPDVLRNVELLKSGIGAEYGGRLSSVLSVQSKEGNSKKIQGAGGLSPITGRLTLEGPIIKDKTTFLIGIRSTYSDWLLRQFETKELKNSQASFYDLNLNVTHQINEKNHLYLSGYASSDDFKLKSDTLYQYSDKNVSLKWKHIFNNKLFGTFTGAASQYNYSISTTKNPVEASSLKFSIQQLNAKADFNYFLNSKNTISAGIHFTKYVVAAGTYEPIGSASKIKTDAIPEEQAYESAIYLGESIELSPALSLYVGARYSYYQNIGPKNVYIYGANAPRQINNIIDTIGYSAGSVIATYHGLEPRASLRYSISKSASLKISFNRMRQYIQMLSNTVAIAPTDIWKLSDTYIPPQVGDQYSIGLYKNFRQNSIETSLEAYYKEMEGITDFKDGANLLLNKHLETDVVKARGQAYGIEFLIKKPSGKLNGWISYTYSRSFLSAQGSFASETINNGTYYPSRYDKPHAFNFIGNYKFSRRLSVSLNVVYSTGRPITLPIAKYDLGGVMRIFYSDRNAFRIPDYFRSDLSFNLEGNHKIKKLAHSSWTFALYNVTSNANAYSVFFTSENGTIQGYKLSVFATVIPTLVYNFKF